MRLCEVLEWKKRELHKWSSMFSNAKSHLLCPVICNLHVFPTSSSWSSWLSLSWQHRNGCNHHRPNANKLRIHFCCNVARLAHSSLGFWLRFVNWMRWFCVLIRSSYELTQSFKYMQSMAWCYFILTVSLSCVFFLSKLFDFSSHFAGGHTK